MRSPVVQTTTRRRNGQLVLPIIYLQPQSKMQRILPLLVVACCGVWIFAIGAMLERVPPGNHLPYMAPLSFSRKAFASGSSVVDEDYTRLQNMAQANGVLSTPVRVLEEADNVDEDNNIMTTRQNEAVATVASSRRATKLPTRTKAKKNKPISHDTNIGSPSKAQQNKIPNVLIFTHALNLLEYQPGTTNATKEEQEELVALKNNIHATMELHPDAKVRFLMDEDCIRSIQSAIGAQSPLIDYFRKESTGMYKADICRGAALWETGGIYLDVDVGVRMPLLDVLDLNTTFATILVHKDSSHLGNFFQAFMATTARHAVLERYLQLFLQHYQGKLSRPIKRGPLGVILLRQAFDDVILNQPKEVSFVNLQRVQTLHDKDKQLLLGPKVFDTAHHGRIQLWQEILYNSKLMSKFVPEPTWGTRRACHFVVVANAKYPLRVPLYSRIEGSRMCPKRNRTVLLNETTNNESPIPKPLGNQGVGLSAKRA